ncbi:MAG: flavodoxin domain-containing protein [Oscillospiraceae bacterium]|nr:flavodoxin domain-containing protein [Oscillospiraceae bacterium]
MNIAVRYQSRGGNSKAVAEAIAKEAGVIASPLDVPLDRLIDLLFIGGGIYAWNIDNELRAYLQNLDPNAVKSVAAFTTGGMLGGTGKIAAKVKARGIAVCEIALPMRMGFQNYAGKKGFAILSDKQNRKVADFVKMTMK